MVWVMRYYDVVKEGEERESGKSSGPFQMMRCNAMLTLFTPSDRDELGARNVINSER